MKSETGKRGTREAGKWLRFTDSPFPRFVVRNTGQATTEFVMLLLFLTTIGYMFMLFALGSSQSNQGTALQIDSGASARIAEDPN